MDRSDASQEGITLPPTNGNRLLIRDEARKIIKEHLMLCPFTQLDIEERIRKQENRFHLLCGFMLGSGVLGGAAGGAMFRAIGG